MPAMMTYQDLLNQLKTLTPNELQMYAQVGTPKGFLSIKRMFHVDETEATNLEDFCGNTLVLDTE